MKPSSNISLVWNPETKTSASQRNTSDASSLFLRNKKKIVAILSSWLMISCGGWGENMDWWDVLEESGWRMQKMSVNVPITNVPTSAPFEVDGMMGYGWIYFEHPISGYATGPYINPFQASSYNPRDVLTKLGTTEWVIVRASFTYDTDKNNDGKTDTTWTPINAGMSMIVHRSTFERGEKIIFSPRSAFLSESLLGRSWRTLSQEWLDTLAREAWVDDTNNDGIINFADITGKKWSNWMGTTLSLPSFWSYMESIYTNNGGSRGNAMKNLYSLQNHIIEKVIPHPTNHDPMLKLETIGNSNILYTLDGSTPLPWWATTIVATKTVTLALQNKRIYYREQIPSGNTFILGKVRGFDLATDWMELSQAWQKYNPNGKEIVDTTSYTYSGKIYTITSISNKTSPGYTYPKFLDCQVGSNQSDGCHLGPYIAYNELHEAKIREFIHSGVQSFITTSTPNPTPPTPPGTTPDPAPSHYQNEITEYTSKISYLGWWYQVQNQWNQSGTKDFPVTIIWNYATPDGIRQPNITAIANNEAERWSFSQAMVGKLKAIIEAKYANLPRPTYSHNQVLASSPVTYKGQTYTLFTTMNTTGYSDYPASVKVVYTTPVGTKETPSLPAKDALELSKVQSERISEAKSQIDMSLWLDEYPPYHSVTITPWRYYAGGKYTTKFTYSGTSGKDYPGYIDVFYQRSNGINGKWTMEVKSETERNLFIPQWENQAKLEIDNFPIKPINWIEKSWNTSYGTQWGTYTRYEKYNRVWTGYNFPVLLWIEYRATSTAPLLDTRNTYWLIEARNSEHLAELRATLETWVRWQIVASWPSDTSRKYASTTGARILDIILPNAHAADAPRSIIIKNAATKITPLEAYSPDTSLLRTYSIWNPSIEFFMKPGFTAPTGKSKVNVVGKSEEEAVSKSQVAEAQKFYREVQVELINKINSIRETSRPFNVSCTGWPCTWPWSTNGITWYTISDLFPSPFSTVQPTTNVFIRIGEYLFWDIATSKVKQIVDEMRLKYPNNFLLMYSIIIEEQSHLLPFEDSYPGARSFWLSQILANPPKSDITNFWYKSQTESSLIDPIKHLAIMNERLEQIKVVFRKEQIPLTPENIWRVWNGWYNCRIAWELCPENAINYWKRVKDYSDNLLKFYDLYSKK